MPKSIYFLCLISEFHTVLWISGISPDTDRVPVNRTGTLPNAVVKSVDLGWSGGLGRVAVTSRHDLKGAYFYYRLV